MPGGNPCAMFVCLRSAPDLILSFQKLFVQFRIHFGGLRRFSGGATEERAIPYDSGAEAASN
jgi:hypothetical protein